VVDRHARDQRLPGEVRADQRLVDPVPIVRGVRGDHDLPPTCCVASHATAQLLEIELGECGPFLHDYKVGAAAPLAC
jgi:hypothetical protein